MKQVLNPKTGRMIEVGGPTYQKLLKEPFWNVILLSQKESSSKKHNSEPYEGVPKQLFCGPRGGAKPRSYPVNTPGRARAALARAHFAPNPQGIRDCVHNVASKMGWLDSKGHIRSKSRAK